MCVCIYICICYIYIYRPTTYLTLVNVSPENSSKMFPISNASITFTCVFSFCPKVKLQFFFKKKKKKKKKMRMRRRCKVE